MKYLATKFNVSKCKNNALFRMLEDIIAWYHRPQNADEGKGSRVTVVNIPITMATGELYYAYITIEFVVNDITLRAHLLGSTICGDSKFDFVILMQEDTSEYKIDMTSSLRHVIQDSLPGCKISEPVSNDYLEWFLSELDHIEEVNEEIIPKVYGTIFNEHLKGIFE